MNWFVWHAFLRDQLSAFVRGSLFERSISLCETWIALQTLDVFFRALTVPLRLRGTDPVLNLSRVN